MFDRITCRCRGLLIGVVLVLTAISASAQSTAFSYQGKLADGASPANGNYDFQFKLFDTSVVGTGVQQGSTVTIGNFAVTDGTFTVQLDFGAAVFTGENRFLEINVKTTSASAFTTLGPRQQLSPTPYAIRSLVATTADGLSVTCVNCITSTQIQSVQGSQITGTIPVASVPAGSTSYIQNTTSPQASGNFNISGDGTVGGTLSANAVNATTQFNISNQRVLSLPGLNNFFAGLSAGQANTTGDEDAFFGNTAGFSNTTGHQNSFFGSGAGFSNTTGGTNSFFGSGTGFANTTGSGNNFFGAFAGNQNTTGNGNSFFGLSAGSLNTTGNGNSLFGDHAGSNNTTGNNNSFFGSFAGNANAGSKNSFFGSSAGQQNSTGINNSFFGSNAGIANTTGFSNAFSGDSAGGSNTSGFNNAFFGSGAGSNNTTGSSNTLVGFGANVPSGSNLTFATAIGSGSTVSTNNTIVLGRNNDTVNVANLLSVNTLGAAGGSQLCRNVSNFISNCSSSLRYKTAVSPFLGGLEIINRLRPIAFTWKQGGARDIGLGAEEVEKVEPLLTFRNDNGEIEGVKYNQLSTIFINAFKEQQAQIEQQKNQLKQQHNQIESLRKLVCRHHRACL
jgi:hypothetical protein